MLQKTASTVALDWNQPLVGLHGLIGRRGPGPLTTAANCPLAASPWFTTAHASFWTRDVTAAVTAVAAFLHIFES